MSKPHNRGRVSIECWTAACVARSGCVSPPPPPPIYSVGDTDTLIAVRVCQLAHVASRSLRPRRLHTSIQPQRTRNHATCRRESAPRCPLRPRNPLPSTLAHQQSIPGAPNASLEIGKLSRCRPVRRGKAIRLPRSHTATTRHGATTRGHAYRVEASREPKPRPTWQSQAHVAKPTWPGAPDVA